MTFKAGDKVRITDEHKAACGSWGEVPVLTVIDVIPQEHGYRAPMVNVRKPDDGDVNGYFAYRLELVSPYRVEGEEIEFEDIRIGDEIRVDNQAGDVLLSRQGKVATIGNDWNRYSLRTDGNSRLDFGDTRKETYTLIKAGPEPDLVREALKEKPEGTVVEFYTSPRKPILARKKQAAPAEGGSKWVVFYPSGQSTMGEKAFVEVVRDDFEQLRWLS